MAEQLTVKEAIEQGYTKWLYQTDGFQGLNDLESITERDFARGTIELVEKESYHPAGMDANTILEKIAEDIACQHDDETGDDTDMVNEALMTIDLSVIEPFVKAIESKLGELNYYRSSGIILTPYPY